MNVVPAYVGMAITATAVAFVATDLVRRYALRNAILDVPNARSSHVKPIPRGGGLSVVLVFIAAALLLLLAGWLQFRVAITLVAGGGCIAIAGFLDDRKTLPVRIRFCVHIIAALFAVLVIGGVSQQSLTHVGLHGIWVGGLVGLVLLTWSTNLFNFMDGIDGIAGSEAIFVAGAGAIINCLHAGDVGLTAAMLVLAFATVGFLIWNWPPARIFMGDVGSGFLGYTLVALGLAASRNGVIPFEVWAILGGVFLIDATVTLVTRMLRRDRWFEAHRSHAYQRLAGRWQAHLPVTMLVIIINLCWLLPWAIVAANYPARAMLCMVAALVPLIALAVVVGAGQNELSRPD